MKVYKTQTEVDADLIQGDLIVDDDVKFECEVTIPGDINAGDIVAGNINAGDINAGDINACDINARDITAGNINYYAFCTVYGSIKCTSHTARRAKHYSPICLDGKLTIKKITKEVTMGEVCKKFGCKVTIKKED
jgi:polyisoprenoid-binding protein YceI